MNIVLFEPQELESALPKTDRRAQHIIEVLKRIPGDTFDAGVINGPRGRATVLSITETALSFVFDAASAAPPVPPITLVVGLPRPQTARDILRDATTLGVGAIHFVRCEKAEASYGKSTLWSSGEWRRQVLAGAEQAFSTQIPEVTHGEPIKEVLDRIAAGASASAGARLCLDNYESPQRLADIALPTGTNIVVAIGSERGWSATERDALRSHGFALAHLGERVLRTETAVIATLTLVRAKLGLM